MATVLLTPEELADQLRLSVKSIYNLRASGDATKLPPTLKVGKHLRWRQADVDAWIDAQLGLAQPDNVTEIRLRA